MADKKLIISSSFDGKGMQEAEKMLKRLQREGLKIGNILKDLDLGTGAGRGRFAKSIVQTEKGMLKLKGTTQDTAQVMKNVYSKQLDVESKQLDNITRRMEKLNKLRTQTVQLLQNESLSREQRARKEAQLERVEGKIVTHEGERRIRQQRLEEFKGGEPGPKLSTRDTAMIAAAIGQAVGGAIQQTGGLIQSFKTMPLNNAATAANLRRDLIQGTTRGDFTLLDTIMQGRVMPGTGREAFRERLNVTGLSDQFGGRKAAGAENAGAGLAALGGMVISALTLGVAGGGGGGSRGITTTAGNIAGAAGGITGNAAEIANRVYGAQAAGSIPTVEAETIRAGVRAQQQSDPMRERVIQNIQETAALRLAASRQLGGGFMRGAYAGAGLGIDPMEALQSTMTVAGRFGAGAANSMMGSVFGFESRGIDRIQAAGMVGGFAQFRGGNTAQGAKDLQDVFAAGMVKGFSDLPRTSTQFFEAIGNAVVRASLASRGGGLAAPEQFAGLLTAGMGQNTTMRDIEKRIGAFGQEAELFQRSPALRGALMQQAFGILGPKTDINTVSAIAGTSIGELLSGGTKQTTALGVNAETARRIGLGAVGTQIRTAAGGAETGTMAARVRDAFNSGNFAAFSDEGLRAQAATMLTNLGDFEDFSSADEFLRSMALNRPLSQKELGGRLTPRGEKIAAQHQKAAAQVKLKLREQEKKESDKAKFVFQETDAVEKAFKAMAEIPPGTWEDAQKTIQSLSELREELDRLTASALAATHALQKEGKPKGGQGRK